MLGGVSGVASFITTDEQLQLNRGCCLLVHAMLPEGFPFHQFTSKVGPTLLQQAQTQSVCCLHRKNWLVSSHLLHSLRAVTGKHY